MNILVLSAANAARSLMLEALLNDMSRGRITAYSAAPTPAEAPHPHTLDLLRGDDIDADDLYPKSWEEFSGPKAPEVDVAIFLDAETAALKHPTFAGDPIEVTWPIEDMKALDEGAQPQAIADTYAILQKRVSAFLKHGPETLDQGELKQVLKRLAKVV